MTNHSIKSRTAQVVTAALLAVALLATLLWGMIATQRSGTFSDGTHWGRHLGVVSESKFLANDTAIIAPQQRIILGQDPINGFGVRSIPALRDVEQQYGLDSLETGEIEPAAIATSPDGSMFYALTSGGRLLGYELADEPPVRALFATDGTGETESPRYVAVSADGGRVFVGRGTGIEVFDARSGAKLDSLPELGPSVSVNTATGAVIVGAGAGLVELRDPTLRETLAILTVDPSEEDLVFDVSNGGSFVVVRTPWGTGAVLDASTLRRAPGFDGVGRSATSVAELGKGDPVLVLTEGERGGELRAFERGGEQVTSIPVGQHSETLLVGNGATDTYLFGGSEVVKVNFEAKRLAIMIPIAVLSAVFALALAATVTAGRWLPRLRAAQARSDAARAAKWASEAEQLREREATAVAERERIESERREQEHQEKLVAIQEWQRAYAEANGGEEPPAGFVPIPVSAPTAAANRTNTMAILSLIFGFGGGLLGIVFGHIALSQIKRSGEGGRGLAIAGTTLGYIGTAALIGYLIYVLVVLGSLGVFS